MKTKKFFYLLGLLFLIFQVPVNAQTVDAINKPNVRIKVNIKKDAQGNIISYDSSYVSTWSSSGKNVSTNIDSLLKVFGFSKEANSPFFEPDSIMNNFLVAPSLPDSVKNTPKEILEELKRLEQAYGLNSFIDKDKKCLSDLSI